MGQPPRSQLLLPPVRPTIPPVQMVRALKLSRSVFAGVCLCAFAAGIVTKVAIDRFMLRQGNDLPELSVQAAAPAAPTPPPRRVTPEFQALPPAAPAPAPSTAPEVEALPLPPQPTVAKAVTPTPTKAVARTSTKSTKAAGAPRAAQVQRSGRSKRLPSVAAATTKEPAPSWVDPFNQ